MEELKELPQSYLTTTNEDGFTKFEESSDISSPSSLPSFGLDGEIFTDYSNETSGKSSNTTDLRFREIGQSQSSGLCKGRENESFHNTKKASNKSSDTEFRKSQHELGYSSSSDTLTTISGERLSYASSSREETVSNKLSDKHSLSKSKKTLHDNESLTGRQTNASRKGKSVSSSKNSCQKMRQEVDSDKYSASNFSRPSVTKSSRISSGVKSVYVKESPAESRGNSKKRSASSEYSVEHSSNLQKESSEESCIVKSAKSSAEALNSFVNRPSSQSEYPYETVCSSDVLDVTSYKKSTTSLERLETRSSDCTPVRQQGDAISLGNSNHNEDELVTCYQNHSYNVVLSEKLLDYNHIEEHNEASTKHNHILMSDNNINKDDQKTVRSFSNKTWLDEDKKSEISESSWATTIDNQSDRSQRSYAPSQAPTRSDGHTLNSKRDDNLIEGSSINSQTYKRNEDNSSCTSSNDNDRSESNFNGAIKDQMYDWDYSQWYYCEAEGREHSPESFGEMYTQFFPMDSDYFVNPVIVTNDINDIMKSDSTHELSNKPKSDTGKSRTTDKPNKSKGSGKKRQNIDIPIVALNVPEYVRKKIVVKKLDPSQARVKIAKKKKKKLPPKRNSLQDHRLSLVFLKNNLYFLSRRIVSYSLNTIVHPLRKERSRRVQLTRKPCRHTFTVHLSYDAYNTIKSMSTVCGGLFPERITNGIQTMSPMEVSHFEACLALRCLCTLRKFRKDHKRLRKRRSLEPVLRHLMKTMEKTFEFKSEEFRKARLNRMQALLKYDDPSQTKTEEKVVINKKIVKKIKNIYKGLKKTKLAKNKKEIVMENRGTRTDVIEIVKNTFTSYLHRLIKHIIKENMNVNVQKVNKMKSLFKSLKVFIDELAEDARRQKFLKLERRHKFNINASEKNGKEQIGLSAEGTDVEEHTQKDGPRADYVQNGNSNFNFGVLKKDGTGGAMNDRGSVNKNYDLPYLAQMVKDTLDMIRETRKKKNIMKRTGRDARRAYSPFVFEKREKERRTVDDSYARNVLTYSYLDMYLVPKKLRLSRNLAKRRVSTIEHNEWGFGGYQNPPERETKWECILNEKVENIRIGHIYSAMNSLEYPYRGHYLFNADGVVARAVDVLRDTLSCIVIITKHSLWQDPGLNRFDRLFSEHKNKLGPKCGVITLSLDKNEVEWVLSMMYRTGTQLWWYINFKSSLKWYFLMKYKPMSLPSIFAIDQSGFRTSLDVVDDLETFGHSAIHKWVRSPDMMLPTSILGNFDSMGPKDLKDFEVSLDDLPKTLRKVEEDWKNVFDYSNRFTPQVIRYSDIR